MKKIVLSFIVLILVTAAFAQTGTSRVTIPFQFRAGDQVLPAGKYMIDMDPAHQRLLLRGAETTNVMWLPTQRASRTAEPAFGMVVFHKYGNTYFLRQIWNAGSRSGFEMTPSSAEREMAKLSLRELATLPSAQR